MDKAKFLAILGVSAVGVLLLAALAAVFGFAATRRGRWVRVDDLSPESRRHWERVWEERRREEPERREQVSRIAAALRGEGVTIKGWAAETKAQAKRGGGSAVAARRIDRIVANGGEAELWEATALIFAGDRLLRNAGWTGRELTALLHGEEMARRVHGAPRLERARVSDLRAGDEVLVSALGEVGARANPFTGSMVAVVAVEPAGGAIEVDLGNGLRLRLRPGDWVHRGIEPGGLEEAELRV